MVAKHKKRHSTLFWKPQVLSSLKNQVGLNHEWAPSLCLGRGPSLEGLWPGIQADDFLEVPDKLAQAVHVRVDVLLHPLLHGVREVDALQVRAQSLDDVLPVFMDPGGKSGIAV